MLGSLKSSLIYYFLRPSLYHHMAELFDSLPATTLDALFFSAPSYGLILTITSEEACLLKVLALSSTRLDGKLRQVR